MTLSYLIAHPLRRLSRLGLLFCIFGFTASGRLWTRAFSTSSRRERMLPTFGKNRVENVETVDIVEILTHAGTANSGSRESGLAFPHGREIELRFAAFGERFHLHLSILNDAMSAGTRVRAVGSGGLVLVDRKPRLCTYWGHLPQGGWVRAVVRSPTSVTVHFLHNGEIHSLEPLFGRHAPEAIPTAPADKSRESSPAMGSPPPHGLPALRTALAETGEGAPPASKKRSPPTNIHHERIGPKEERRQNKQQRSGDSNHFSPIAPNSTAIPTAIHVAYRRSDLEPRPSSREYSNLAEGLSSSPPSPAAGKADGSSTGVLEVTKTTVAEKHGSGSRLLMPEIQRKSGEYLYHDVVDYRDHHHQSSARSYSEQQQQVRHESSKRRYLEQHQEGEAYANAFRMPGTVENGVGATWEEGPFGPLPECPSSARVFQLGIAMDTGYFKAATGYGVDGAGNEYGQPQLSLADAIDLAESEVQGIVSLVNVLYTDQMRVFIQVKDIEIRTEVVSSDELEDVDPLEEKWNHEPLDHTRHKGEGRFEYGCPFSRTGSVSSRSASSGEDHVATLKGFAEWRRSLPPSELLGLWQLLTACYDEGVQGLTYIGAACSDNLGVGWVSRRPFGTWEVMAHELGHSLGGGDFLDTTKDMMRMIGRWNDFAMERDTSRKEVCEHILANDDCFQPYEPTCGNSLLEPGEECDDDSPCCNPNTCKLVPKARCSQGPGWALSPLHRKAANWTAEVNTAEGWRGQCCSDECQFMASTTICKVPGGDRKGICGNGGCRRTHMPTINYWSYQTCVQPKSPDFNPCLDHYQSVEFESANLLEGVGRDGSENQAEGENVGSDGDGGGDDDSERFECVEEARYSLPAGTVCDHEDYKECNEDAECLPVAPPEPAQKRKTFKKKLDVIKGVGETTGSNNEGEISDNGGDGAAVDNDDTVNEHIVGDNEDDNVESPMGGGGGAEGKGDVRDHSEGSGDEGDIEMEIGEGETGKKEDKERGRNDEHGENKAGEEGSREKISTEEGQIDRHSDNDDSREDGGGRGGRSDNESVGGVHFSLVYKGCFQDTQLSKDLGGGSKVFKDLTAHTCGKWCTARGHSVIGLQNGRRCTCGDTSGGKKHPRLSEGRCNVACKGDRTENCGAFAVNSIFRIVLEGKLWRDNAISWGESSNGNSGGAGRGEEKNQDAQVGQQGRGVLAGSRIRWTRSRNSIESGGSGGSILVPTYYDEVDTSTVQGDIPAPDGTNNHLQSSVEKGRGEEEKEETGKAGGGTQEDKEEEEEEEEKEEEEEEEEEEAEEEVYVEYLGCFRDHPGRLREFFGMERGGREQDGVKDKKNMKEGGGYDGDDGDGDGGGDDAVFVFAQSLTPDVCKRRCQSVGMPYFGLQHGRECRCDDHPPYYAPASNCVSPCTGDRTFVCGGAWANTVYRIHGLGLLSVSGGSSVDDGSLESNEHDTRKSESRVKPRESAGSFKYLGCYSGDGSTDLNGTKSVSEEQRPQLCGTFCKSLKYPFFGVGWSKECSCGNSYGSFGRSNTCDFPCIGSPSVNCGGAWSTSVYTTGTNSTAAPPEGQGQPQEKHLQSQQPKHTHAPSSTVFSTVAPTSSPTSLPDKHQRRPPPMPAPSAPITFSSRSDQPYHQSTSSPVTADHFTTTTDPPATDGLPPTRARQRHLLSRQKVSKMSSTQPEHENLSSYRPDGDKSRLVGGSGARKMIRAEESSGAFEKSSLLHPLHPENALNSNNAQVSLASTAQSLQLMELTLGESYSSSGGGDYGGGDGSSSSDFRGKQWGAVAPKNFVNKRRGLSYHDASGTGNGEGNGGGGSGDDGDGESDRDGGGTSSENDGSEQEVAASNLPIKVLHPLNGELLITGAVASVTWKSSVEVDGESESSGSPDQGVDLWAVLPGGQEALIARGVGIECGFYVDVVCQYPFVVPSIPVNGGDGAGGELSILELRGLGGLLLGRSNQFAIKAKTSFAFLSPHRDSTPVRGDVMEISWKSIGSTNNVWISLHDSDTGAVAANIGAASNTESLRWVLPRHVRQGVYYLTIRSLVGSRKMETEAVSELFRVASPSVSTVIPPLSLVTPVLDEYIDIGNAFMVTWTSADIRRVKLTLQNEWEWDVKTLLFEGENDNQFSWEVPPVKPGVGYYLQLENPDDDSEDKWGVQVIGGIGETGFELVGRGVRTRPFIIEQKQPKVFLGDIFRGQTGDVWTKGVQLEIDLDSSGSDDHGKPLPVKLELMRGSRPVLTVPGSPASISASTSTFVTQMPDFEPPDGMYHLRATSMLHHQALAISPEFEVTSYIPVEWGGISSTLAVDTSLEGEILEEGKSYEIRWSSSFVGHVSAKLRRHKTSREKGYDIPLAGGTAFPNTGNFWMKVPFLSDEEEMEWCHAPFTNPAVTSSTLNEKSRSNKKHDASSSKNNDHSSIDSNNSNSDSSTNKGNTTSSSSSSNSNSYTINDDDSTGSNQHRNSHSSSGTSTDDSADDPENKDDGCCFTFTVSDAHDTHISDSSGVFCLATPAPLEPGGAVPSESMAGVGGRAGVSISEKSANLEIVKSPGAEWQKGTAQEIKWTSEGLTSPVSLNLLTPEAAEAPDKKQKEDTSNDEDDDHDDYLPPETVEKEHQGNGGSDDDGDNDNDSDDDDDDNDVDNNNLGVGLVPEERTMKGRIVLESALPSAGFLLTNGGPEIMDMPAGDGYSIEVIDSSGTVQAVSPPFRLTDPPGVTIVSDARTAAVHKGDMARIEWNFADKPFPVRVQLFKGSPEPRTISGRECVPFKAFGNRWEARCVQDPTSPLYQQCATEVDSDLAPRRTGHCMDSTGHMKVIWQSEEIPPDGENGGVVVQIPREEFELPSAGPSYFWRVVSVLDPQLHSESQTFPLDYPSTLIFFRARGLSLVKACQDDGKALIKAMEALTRLKQGRLELRAVGGAPCQTQGNNGTRGRGGGGGGGGADRKGKKTKNGKANDEDQAIDDYHHDDSGYNSRSSNATTNTTSTSHRNRTSGDGGDIINGGSSGSSSNASGTSDRSSSSSSGVGVANKTVPSGAQRGSSTDLDRAALMSTVGDSSISGSISSTSTTTSSSSNNINTASGHDGYQRRRGKGQQEDVVPEKETPQAKKVQTEADGEGQGADEYGPSRGGSGGDQAARRALQVEPGEEGRLEESSHDDGSGGGGEEEEENEKGEDGYVEHSDDQESVLEVTFRVSPTTSSQERSPKEIVNLMGLLCEFHRLNNNTSLGDVDCESIGVRDEYSDYSSSYSRFANRDTPSEGGHLLLGFGATGVAAGVMVLSLCFAVLVLRQRWKHSKKGRYWQSSFSEGVGGTTDPARYSKLQRYSQLGSLDYDAPPAEGEDAYGQIDSPGSFAGALDDIGDATAGHRRGRDGAQPKEGFREAASSIVAKVLSGGKGDSTISSVNV